MASDNIKHLQVSKKLGGCLVSVQLLTDVSYHDSEMSCDLRPNDGATDMMPNYSRDRRL